MRYHCCDQRRREAVRRHAALDGIDYLEVLDRDAPQGSPRQRTLLVRFLGEAPELSRDNVTITGGQRVTPVRVQWAAPASAIPPVLVTPEEQAAFAGLPQAEQVLVVRTDSTGDFSMYTLHLVATPGVRTPPAGIDPELASVPFSFKVECASDLDCRPVRVCPPEALEEPDIDYLVKDYASFRRVMLDRMSTLMPAWRERNAADLGVALVELLAYVGDHLSYQQDAVATEAYLGTARRRVSVRRHARLVDYHMHDGCNARVWVQVRVDAAGVMLPAGTPLLTKVSGAPERIQPASRAYEQALAQGPEVFETMHQALLHDAHDTLRFHTWGERACCLPAGSTRATLAGHHPELRPGDVLVFAEVLGPETGRPEDADPARRHAVRLTEVSSTHFELTEASFAALLGAGVPGEVLDDLEALRGQRHGSPRAFVAAARVVIGVAATEQFGPLLLSHAERAARDPLSDEAVTEITWHAGDALRQALCISAVTALGYRDDVSVALGNIVLADHGRTVVDEPLGEVPAATALRAVDEAGDHCAARRNVPVFQRYRPRLQQGPLTQAGTVLVGEAERTRVPFDPSASAAAAFTWRPEDVLPSITLDGGTWSSRRDLLASDRFAREFVVEVEADGTTELRFGDGVNGLRPSPGDELTATYRVGNGVAGHVGAEAIAHVVSADGAVVAVRNPLPARGGVEPETMEEVRQRAPSAFRIQERAVTASDYAEVTERRDGVRAAAATMRWTGSWHTAFVTVDPVTGNDQDASFRQAVLRHVDRYRLSGHDLKVDGPRYVPLDIAMLVCAAPDYLRGDVRSALWETFSNRELPDGRRGVFHPDEFRFGQPVHVSRLYAAAHAVAGVASVSVKRFRRLGSLDGRALREGRIALGRLEVARLDNDPNDSERGRFELIVEGGR